MALLGGLALLVNETAVAQVDVLTNRQDATRSGLNLKETELTPDLVRKRFGKLCCRSVDGNSYAQPLVVTRSRIIQRDKPVNVVIVATEHNSVYAFDADDINPHSKKAQLWRTDDTVFGKSVPSETLSQDLGNGAGGCVDLTTEIGITGTPAILLTKDDAPKEGVIFVVAKSLDDQHNYSFRLHVLNLFDGKPVGAPVPIEGEVKGEGAGSANGRIVFAPLIQHQRPALLLNRGTLYIGFCGHCDSGLFHGWLFAYDVSNPKAPEKLDVLCTTPNVNMVAHKDGEGGIWMSGQGPSADDEGNIYLTTGNGSYRFDRDGKNDFGDSVLRLRLVGKTVKVIDHFTPQDENQLKLEDADLGSSGVCFLPGTKLMTAGGKEGRLYLLDRDNMSCALQEFQVTRPPGPKPVKADLRYWNIHGAPVAWKSKSAFTLFICGEEDPVKAYSLIADTGTGHLRFGFTPPHSDRPIAYSEEAAPNPGYPRGVADTSREDVWMPGGFLALSANGDEPSTGILWACMPRDDNANHRVVDGVLRAFDPTNFEQRPGNHKDLPKRIVQIWSSDHDDNKTTDSVGKFAKFNPPTVANGKVFVAAFQEEEPAPGNGFQVHKEKRDGQHSALVIYGLK